MQTAPTPWEGITFILNATPDEIEGVGFRDVPQGQIIDLALLKSHVREREREREGERECKRESQRERERERARERERERDCTAGIQLNRSGAFPIRTPGPETTPHKKTFLSTFGRKIHGLDFLVNDL